MESLCGRLICQCHPAVHLVPVTFKAGDKPGEIEQTIEIETDLAIGGKTSCLARGTIQGETEEKPDVATKARP